jgi:hypothetical protein
MAEIMSFDIHPDEHGQACADLTMFKSWPTWLLDDSLNEFKIVTAVAAEELLDADSCRRTGGGVEGLSSASWNLLFNRKLVTSRAYVVTK